MSGIRYTAEQKEDVRRRLELCDGDVPFVSIQTGIPERTIYRWVKSWQKKSLSLTSDLLGIPKEEFDASLEAAYKPGEYTELRDELMRHIKQLSKTLSDDPDLAHRRVIALTRLLDKVFKLENLTRLEQPQVTLIKYEYNDKTIHDIPPWQNEVYSKADKAYWAALKEARKEYEANQKSDSTQPTDTSLTLEE